MATTQLEKLMFTIGMVDRISKPVAGVTHQVEDLVNTAKSGFADIAVGGAGLLGAGFAIKEMLGPAIEMDRALGEVKSLGVADSALKQLSATALEFSTQYGKSATEFVSASYDIQSAIAGLTGSELSAFTKSSGVLAAATKADTATITNYMGTMYGIFQDNAKAMGKADWVEQVAGMTASAVQMFKTNGMEMSSAFGALGASAQSAGVDMAEQMAVLGTLQATMSGSEAATKYKAFLSGIGKAQDALGLSFTDSEGNMLGMMDIMTKLQGKYGDSFTVSESDELASAFGTSEAVDLVKLLMTQTDGLSDSINKLGKTKGMEAAEQMAAAMVDPWAQMESGIEAVRIGLGQSLLPVINPIVSVLAEGAKELSSWTQMFPNITRVVGITAVTIIGLTAAMAAVTLVVGFAKTAMAGWLMITKTARLATIAFAGAQWLMNAAFVASPIGLIVIGVSALVAVVYAAWLGIKALWSTFSETSSGQAIISFIKSVIAWFGQLGEMIGSTINWVIDKINMIPGISIGSDEATAPPQVESLNAGRVSSVPAGGVTKQISNAVTQSSSRSINIGKIETSKDISPSTVNEILWMEGA